MKGRKKTFSAYVVIFAAFMRGAAGMLEPTEASWRRHIEKMSYQLGYENTYSPVFSPYAVIAGGEGENYAVMETVSKEAEAREESRSAKTAYLTFDDGPSSQTERILDILKRQDVKATFFVVKGGKDHSDSLKRAAMEGHAIGVHSSSHVYNRIYASVNDYLADFTDCYDYITQITGKSPTIFRFPGGSVNSYNAAVRKDLVREMTRRGFVYFDWNVESGDGSGRLSAETIYSNVINGCKGKKRAVIIMHDAAGKKTTADALEDIIVTLREDGWTFAPLDNTVKPMVFRMK